MQNKILKKLFLAGCVISMILFAASSYAVIKVSPLFHSFGTGYDEPFFIAVKNPEKEKEYVGIKGYTVAGLGTDHEKEVPIKKLIKKGILVSPRKFVLKPGKTRKVRISLVKGLPKDQDEKIFLIVQPVKNLAAQIHKKEDFNVAIHTVLAYRVGLYIHKKNGKPNIVTTKSGDDYQFTNKGDTAAFLKVTNGCPDKKVSDEKPCEPLYNFWIYPNEKVKVKSSYPIKASRRYLNGKKKIDVS